MTPKERAAMQQALEALEALMTYDYHGNPDNDRDIAGAEAITALREVLAEPDIEEMTLTQITARHRQVEQEPIGEVVMESMGVGDAQIVRLRMNGRIPPVGTKLYAAPVQQVDLTGNEINRVWESVTNLPITTRETTFARAVIAADREKNR